MNTREYWLSKKYYDVKKFPYGFSRAGDFTLRQSVLLETKGALIKALLEDQVST